MELYKYITYIQIHIIKWNEHIFPNEWNKKKMKNHLRVLI